MEKSAWGSVPRWKLEDALRRGLCTEEEYITALRENGWCEWRGHQDAMDEHGFCPVCQD